MINNKKGFTLIELLAVIVILGIIMVIATTNVLKSIRESREKTKYMAAKEIVGNAEAYFAVNNGQTCVNVTDLESYLESDTTNPETGENDLFKKESGSYKYQHSIIKDATKTQQSGYSISSDNEYIFDGYIYKIGESCPTS